MVQRCRPYPALVAASLVLSAAPAPAGAQPAPATAASASQAGVARGEGARIEGHIAHLHASLRITPAQERLWQGFAAALRENVARMDAAYAGRQRDHATADAVRDLQAFGAIEDANARNVQLLLPPFRALYDSFSPEQKRTADATFRRYTDKAVRRPD